jgi:hypothetical protein
MNSASNLPGIKQDFLSHLDRELFELMRMRMRQGGEMGLVVPTGSMKPVIKPGDKIIVSWPEESFQHGNIVVYWRSGILVCHQIHRVFVLSSLSEGQLLETRFIQTAGTNGIFDPPLNERDILGVARVAGKY